jgi:Big-like domain-containing protein
LLFSAAIHAIAVDPAGAVWLAGVRWTPAGTVNAWIAKHAITGALLGEDFYREGLPGYSEWNAVSVDPAGEVYVAGWTSEVTAGQDIPTARYATDVSRVWRVVRNGTANGQDIAQAVVAVADGVIVAADAIAYGEPSKVLLIKYGAQLAPSGLSVTVNPPTVHPGQSFTVTAPVVGAAGAPTGTVTFREGFNNLCLALPVTPAGPNVASASCIVSSVALGNRTVIVSYSGDLARAPETVSVNVPVADPPPEQIPGLTRTMLVMLAVVLVVLGAGAPRRR